jgi:hypothetical protein
VATTRTFADRLRIERTVWRFDMLLYDLPTRARRAVRKELRANLIAAAEHGADAAVRQLGDLKELAEGYLEVEYGPPARRPQWRKGIFWAVAAELLVMLTSLVGFVSFMDGVQAAGGHASGTYRWGGWLGSWGPTGEVTLDDGMFSGFLFEASPALFVLPFLAFLLGSRAWRTVAPWWRHRRAAQARPHQEPTRP